MLQEEAGKKGWWGAGGRGNSLLCCLKLISFLERWREFHFGGEQTKSLGDIKELCHFRQKKSQKYIFLERR